MVRGAKKFRHSRASGKPGGAGDAVTARSPRPFRSRDDRQKKQSQQPGKPKVVLKPWGKEIWFAHTPKYVGKLLFIRKGHRLSKQYHRFKDETLYTDKGTYLLEMNGKTRRMPPGSVVRFRPGTIHRMEARFGDVRIIEVSTSQLKDVVRLEDDYARVSARKGQKQKR